jgi:hypothetical protein
MKHGRASRRALVVVVLDGVAGSERLFVFAGHGDRR